MLLYFVMTAAFVKPMGDLTAAVFVARSEGEELLPRPATHEVALGPPAEITPMPETPAAGRDGPAD